MARACAYPSLADGGAPGRLLPTRGSGRPEEGRFPTGACMFYMIGAGLDYEDTHNRVNLTVVRQSKD